MLSKSVVTCKAPRLMDADACPSLSYFLELPRFEEYVKLVKSTISDDVRKHLCTEDEFNALFTLDNLQKKDSNGRTALHWAAKSSKKHLPSLLNIVGITAADVNMGDIDGNTPLHLFFDSLPPMVNISWCQDYLKALFKAGANPIALNNAGQTPESLARLLNLECWAVWVNALKDATAGLAAAGGAGVAASFSALTVSSPGAGGAAGGAGVAASDAITPR